MYRAVRSFSYFVQLWCTAVYYVCCLLHVGSLRLRVYNTSYTIIAPVARTPQELISNYSCMTGVYVMNEYSVMMHMSKNEEAGVG